MTFDYTGTPLTLTITNAINPAAYTACDAGTPGKKVDKLYEDVKNSCVKWEYAFYDDGTFVVGTKSDANVVTRAAKGTAKSSSNDYVVVATEKFKNTDRKIPAYRTFNGKVLKVGDSVKFVTNNKDEVIFYEKLVEAFGSKAVSATSWTGGELTLAIEATATE